MSKINTLRLAAQVGDTIYRANSVRTDPPVVKAAQQAQGDTAQALSSVGALLHEMAQSWARHAPVGGRDRMA